MLRVILLPLLRRRTAVTAIGRTASPIANWARRAGSIPTRAASRGRYRTKISWCSCSHAAAFAPAAAHAPSIANVIIA